MFATYRPCDAMRHMHAIAMLLLDQTGRTRWSSCVAISSDTFSVRSFNTTSS